MPAVASSSTLADVPDTPHHRAVPETSTPVRTPSASPHANPPPPRQGRAGPSRVVGRHEPRRRIPVRPSRCPTMNANPAREPAGTNKDCVPIGWSMPAAPASLPGGQGYRRRWTCWGCSPCPHPRDQPKGNRSRTPHLARLTAQGNGSGTHQAVPEGAALPATFLAPAMLARMRRDAPWRLDFPWRGGAA